MLRSGIYPSRPPYGYKRVPISKDKTEIVIDEYASKVVKKAYEWYATSGFSIELLREKLKKEYGISWSKGFTDKVLKDHFYYGLMTWNRGKSNEKVYPHKYTHIIEKSLFDQVQKIKAGFHKKPFKYAGNPFTLELTNYEPLIDFAADVQRKLNIRFPFNLEVFETKLGKFVMGEINTRFGNGVVFTAKAGIDMVSYLATKDDKYIGTLNEGVYSRYLEEIEINPQKSIHLE